MEFQSFENSEEELRYFIRSFYNKTWKWSDQYERDPDEDILDFLTEEEKIEKEETRMSNQLYAVLNE